MDIPHIISSFGYYSRKDNYHFLHTLGSAETENHNRLNAIHLLSPSQKVKTSMPPCSYSNLWASPKEIIKLIAIWVAHLLFGEHMLPKKKKNKSDKLEGKKYKYLASNGCWLPHQFKFRRWLYPSQFMSISRKIFNFVIITCFAKGLQIGIGW